MTLPSLSSTQTDVLLAIFEAADRGSSGPHPVLLDVLRAYESVLPTFGVPGKTDTFYYRFLLQLSLNPAVSWWQKLDDEQQKAGQYVDPRVRVKVAAGEAAGFARAPYKPSSPASQPLPIFAPGSARLSQSPTAALSPLSKFSPTFPTANQGASAIVSPSYSGVLLNTVQLPRSSVDINPKLFNTEVQSPVLDATENFTSSFQPALEISSSRWRQNEVVSFKGHDAADWQVNVHPHGYYGEFSLKARAFRRWVASVVYAKEERKLVNDVNEIKIASALAAHTRRHLQLVFRGWAAACREVREERGGTFKAVQHWANRLTKNAFRGWRRAVVAYRPTPLYNSVQIRAAFKWVAVTLPDHGEWWRLAATHAALSAAAHDAGKEALGAHAFSPKRTYLVNSSAIYEDFRHSSAQIQQGLNRGRSLHARVKSSLSTPIRSSSVSPLRPAISKTPLARRSASGSPQRPQVHAQVFAASLTPSMHNREERLSRLRNYVVSRLSPSLRKLPLLEHATAILDADTIIGIFSTWKHLTRYWIVTRAKIQRFQQRHAVRRWYRQVAKTAFLARSAHTTACLHEKYELARAWFAWRRQHAEVVFEEYHASRCYEFRQLWLAKRSFARWKQYMTFVSRLRDRAARYEHNILTLVFKAWTAYTARKAAVSLRQRQFARFSRAIALANALAAWRTAGHLQQCESVAETYYTQRSLQQALLGWKVGQHEQRATDMNFTMLVHKKCVSRAWMIWRRQLQCAKLLRQADRRKRHLMMGMVLASLQLHREGRHASVDRAETAYAQFFRQSCARAVMQWRTWTCRSTKLQAKLQVFRLQHSVSYRRKIFHAFRVAHQRAQRCRSVVVKWQQAKLHQSLNKWLACTRFGMRARKLLRQCIFRMQHQTAVRIFASLKDHAQQAKRARMVQLKVVRALQNVQLGKCIRKWHDIIKYRQRFQSVAEKAIRRIMQISVARSFSTWCTFIEQRRRERAIMLHTIKTLQHIQLSKALHSWLDAIAYKKRSQNLMTTVIQRMMHRKMHQSVLTWQQNTRMILKAKRVVARVIQAFRSNALLRSLNQWRQIVRAKAAALRLMKRVAITMLNCKVLGAIRKWREVASTGKQLQIVARRILQRMRWLGVAKAFSRWVEFREHRKDIKARALKCIHNMLNFKLVSSIRAWKDNTAAIKKSRASQLRTLAIMKMRLVASAFHSLVALLQRRRRLHEEAEQFFVRRHAAMVKRVLRSWHMEAANSAKIQATARRVINTLMNAKLVASVRTWHASAMHDRLNIRKRKLQLSRQRRTKAACLHKWLGKLTKRQSTEILLPRLGFLVQKHVTSVALHRWLHFVRKMKAAELFLHAIFRSVSTNLLQDTFQCWHKSIVAKKRRNAHLDQQASLWRCRIQQRAIAKWKLTAKARTFLKLFSSNIENAHCRRYFSAWKLMISNKKRLQAVGQKVGAALLRYSLTMSAVHAVRTWKAFSAWRTSLSHKCEEVRGRQRRRTVAVWFGRWRASHSAVSHHKNAMLRKAFLLLGIFLRQQQSRKHVMKMAHHRVLRSCMNLWSNSLQVRREILADSLELQEAIASAGLRAQGVCNNAAGRWFHFDTARAWQSWKVFHLLHRQSRQRAAHADAIKAHFLIKSHFTQWLKEMQMLVKERHATAYYQRSAKRAMLIKLRLACTLRQAYKAQKAVDLRTVASFNNTVQRRRTRVALHHWASHHRHVQNKLLEYVEQRSSATILRVIAFWNGAARSKRILKLLAQQLRTLYQKRRLQTAVLRIQQFAANRKRVALLQDTLFATRSRQRALHTWNAAARTSISHAAACVHGKHLIDTHVNRSKISVIRAWKVVGCRKRLIMLKAVRFATQIQRSIAQGAFSTWLRVFSAQSFRNYDLSRRLAQWHNQRAVLQLQLWKSAARRHRIATSALVTTQKAVCARVKVVHFGAWKHGALQRTLLRRALHALLAGQVRAQLATAIQTWVGAARRETILLRLIKTCQAVMSHNLREHILRKWKAYAIRTRVLRSAMSLTAMRTRDNLLLRATSKWLMQTKAVNSLLAREQWYSYSITMALRSDVLRAIWQVMQKRSQLRSRSLGWVSYAARSTMAKAMGDWCRLAWKSRTRRKSRLLNLQRVIHMWQRRSYESGCAAQLRVRARHTLLRLHVQSWKNAYTTRLSLIRLLQAWKGFASKQGTLKQCSASTSRWLNQIRAKRAVLFWRRCTRLNKISRAAQQSRMAWAQRLAFEAIRAFAVYRQSKRARLAHARAALFFNQQRRAFYSWHQVISDAKRFRIALVAENEIRMRIDRKMERARLRRLGNVWNAWHRYVVQQKCSRQIAERFALRPALSRWRDVVGATAERSLRRQQLLRNLQQFIRYQRTCIMLRWNRESIAARFRRLTAMKRAFTTFAGTCSTQRRNRCLMQERLAGFHVVRQKKHVLSAWLAFISARQLLQYRVQTVQSICATRMVRTAIHSWLRAANQSRMVKIFCHRRHRKQLAESVKIWRKAASAAAHMHVLERRAERFYKKRMIAVIFTAWKGRSYRKIRHGYTIPTSIHSTRESFQTPQGFRRHSTSHEPVERLSSAVADTFISYRTPASVATSHSVSSVSSRRTTSNKLSPAISSDRPLVPVLPPAFPSRAQLSGTAYPGMRLLRAASASGASTNGNSVTPAGSRTAAQVLHSALGATPQQARVFSRQL